MGLHVAGDGFNYRNHDGVPELTIRLRIRYRDLESVLTWPVKTHQAGALPSSQSAWVLSISSPDKDLGTVLEVPRRKSPRDVFRSTKPISKSVPFCPVLCRICLKVSPQVI